MLESNDQEILNRALNALEQGGGVRLEVEENQTYNDVGYDAQLRLGQHRLWAEVKKWVAQTNFGALVHQLEQLPEKTLLVADYVNPNMADRLRERKFQFIDTAGNAYLDLPHTYVFIKGNRLPDRRVEQKVPTQRAFTATGLKVVYAFLRNPALAAAPYRDIAQQAGVAVGTVGWVINDLKAAGFLIDRGRGHGRRLKHYRPLLDQWTNHYPAKLRAKQYIGTFIADKPAWWKDLNIQQYGAYWGGEIAAEKYTRFLTPQVAIVYLERGTQAALMKAGRLRKTRPAEADTPGVVTLYAVFWPAGGEYTGYVDPVLAYADLIATGDPRNLEAADILFENHLARHNEPD